MRASFGQVSNDVYSVFIDTLSALTLEMSITVCSMLLLAVVFHLAVYDVCFEYIF